MSATASWISKKPGRCGGDTYVREFRLPVWGAVRMRPLGASDQVILEAYPFLTAGDLDAVWKYAEANSEEIEKAIQENEAGENGVEE